MNQTLHQKQQIKFALEFLRYTKALWVDSQLDCPLRDHVWNSAPFQSTAVHEPPRTGAGRGAPRAPLRPQGEQENHGEPREGARLRGGTHCLWRTSLSPGSRCRRGTILKNNPWMLLCPPGWLLDPAAETLRSSTTFPFL